MEQGWWTPETLGQLLADGLRASPGTGFVVHSTTRPYAGSFADVESRARRLAAGLLLTVSRDDDDGVCGRH